jgi:hypothetical protein
LVTACLLAVALAACGGAPVKSDGRWVEGVTAGQSFGRILVVGVSPDVNQRCAFEDSMVQALQSQGATAASTCSVLGIGEPLTRESVERGVASFGADAVLATRPLGSSMQVKEGGTIETRGDAYYKATDWGYATDYWGVYGVPVVYGEFQTAPADFYLQGAVRVVSGLYRTSDATHVYTVKTDAERVESRQQGMMIVTTGIAGQLRKAGLLR